jgi:hypothetical protein
MARQRRGGFRTPELRGTLGTLLRTTREVLERGAREGRERLDEALAGRRRTDALADLGEVVLDLIRRGEIDLDEIPEARDIVAHLDELDAGSHDRDDDRHAPPPPPSRKRFDDRAGKRRPAPRADDDGTVASGTWTPPPRAKPAKPEPKVWRPPPVAAKPKAKGGISFDEDSDEDLASYMHPDDVPPKDPPDGDS